MSQGWTSNVASLNAEVPAERLSMGPCRPGLEEEVKRGGGGPEEDEEDGGGREEGSGVGSL